MAVHGEDAQGKTADSKVKALDGNLWVQLPPITPKTFLKSFQKGIDKSQGLWYNKITKRKENLPNQKGLIL
jgi:hypothetical protein